MRRALSVLVVGVLALASCSDLEGTGDRNYLTSTGQVVEVEPDDRGDPVEVSGETLDGETLDLADYRGRPVVVNVWGSWCAECRVEMPLIIDAVDELAGDAAVVGINIREPGPDSGRAFQRKAGMEFPSVYDPGSEQLLSFPEPFNPRFIPSTMILDSEGRLAALISGQIPSKTTLLDVVEEIAAEDT